MSVNKATLIGHLGQNPDVKQAGGQNVATFSVATNEKWTDKAGAKQEHTEWHRIVAWGKLADLAGQYLEKGRQVYIEGKIQTRKWQDKEGKDRYTTEIVANRIEFLGSKGEGGGNRPPHPGDEGMGSPGGETGDNDGPL